MIAFRSLPGFALAAVLACAAPAVAQTPPAQSPIPLLPGIDRAAIERIVHDYLIQHPEVLVEAINEIRRRQEQASADQAQKAIVDQHKEIFDDAMTPVGGNPQGDVTIVEFFDYHCGYCKQVQPSMESLIKEDGKIRVVFKELPILAPESRIAAAGALAAQRQGKYTVMHNALMSARGTLTKARVLQIGRDNGLDVAKLEKDMQLPEIDAAIERNLKLAAALDISGTPSFVIGGELVPGAIDIDDMRKLIAKARKG
jgi:protein-disulfide isomerase